MTPSIDRTPVGQNYDGPNSLIETLRGCQTRKARTMHGELILAMTARLLSTALTTRLALSRLSESAPRSKTVRWSHSRMMFCCFDAPQQGQQGGRFRTQPGTLACVTTHILQKEFAGIQTATKHVRTKTKINKAHTNKLIYDLRRALSDKMNLELISLLFIKWVIASNQSSSHADKRTDQRRFQH